jgi:nitrilase
LAKQRGPRGSSSFSYGDPDREVVDAAHRGGALVGWQVGSAEEAAAAAQAVYVASTWDQGDTWITTLRHIAAEGRCWVIGSGCSLRASDLPATFPDREHLFPDPDEWLNDGDSVVIAPGGTIVAGPLHQEHGRLLAEIEPSRAAADHRTLDVARHYSRDDIFSLVVDRSPRAPVTFTPTQPLPQPRDVSG